ncbi:hypothetical protein LJR255_003806 [Pararhizobium sp. LjRoot255]|jgi:hypothetical protein|uniref:hypothetical protein n=1 Tax=Pararhizobium sp. LjRoot255 TaxID=3342298 RepID=UPI003ECED96A
MRYYGIISRDQVIFLIALALSFATVLNLRAVAKFVALEGNILSEMQSLQAQAKLAAFKHIVLGGDDQDKAGLHRWGS